MLGILWNFIALTSVMAEVNIPHTCVARSFVALSSFNITHALVDP